METRYGPKFNHEHVKRSEVRIKARQDLLKVYNPGEFGAKSSVDVTSGGKPLDAKSLCDIEIARRIAFAITIGQRLEADAPAPAPDPFAD